MAWSALFSLFVLGGDLPEGARLSVRFEPPKAKAGAKTTLEISVTPPPGSVLLAFAQPKSLGAPTAVNLEPGALLPAGPLDEPSVRDRPVPAINAEKVRYYPQSFGGTVVVKLPMAAPTSFDEGRATLRGTVTLLFVDERTGRLTIAPALPIMAELEEETSLPVLVPAAAVEPPPVIMEAPPKQQPEPPAAPPPNQSNPGDSLAPAGPRVEIIVPDGAALPPPSQAWFLLGAAAGLLALGVGPIGLYDGRRWWARWLGWRRFQAWAVVLGSASLSAAVLILPTRTAIPVLVGSAAFGAMLVVTGGGPGVRSTNFVAAAVRAQPALALVLCLAALLKGACWDAAAGFAAVFLSRSCAPAVIPAGGEDGEEDEDEEPPRRKRSKPHRWKAA